jgi:hypothetical protein
MLETGIHLLEDAYSGKAMRILVLRCGNSAPLLQDGKVQGQDADDEQKHPLKARYTEVRSRLCCAALLAPVLLTLWCCPHVASATRDRLLALARVITLALAMAPSIVLTICVLHTMASAVCRLLATASTS